MTPWLKSWVVVAAWAVGILGSWEELAEWLPQVVRDVGLGRVILVALAGLTGVFAIVMVWAVLWWRKASFRLTDDSIQLSTGVVFRRRRHLRFDRVQAVDLVRPLIPRVFGLVKLRVEAAGGAGSSIQLAYLRHADAVRWRQRILTRAHHSSLTNAVPTGHAPGLTPPKSAETVIGEALGDADAEAPELFAVPTGRLIGSMALSVGIALNLLTIIAIPAVAIWRNGLAGIAVAIPIALGAGAYTAQRFTQDFGFSAKQTARGLTLSHGLTTRVSQTVPPGRILAVSFAQGPLWRRFGWWRATMTVAGYGRETNASGIMAPVADSETIRRVLWALAPALAQDDVWDAVTAAMGSRGPREGFTTAPRRARFFDPLAWRRTAFAVSEEAVVLRLGALRRRVDVLPHGRIQAIQVTQGPLERLAALASVALLSAAGPFTSSIEHLSAHDADRLARDQAARLAAAWPAP
ncbi:MAG: PH domain-containing protein [Bifidobacteriaceae bacterium]|nr:PH domain-containing protein [Bifidobacteriaceae bacterium]